NGVLTRRSRLIVDVPMSVTPRIQEHNVHFKRRDVESRGRRVYTWATTDVQKIQGEPSAASPNTLAVHIAVGAPIGWADLARWYAKLSAGRYALTPALEGQLAEHVKDARSLEDSLRAVHRWVSQDFRYVSLSLGIGGYLPRLPAQVLETRYGDCKDKATLFIALVRKLGLNAYPVLLSSSGSADSTLPTVQQFDHMIAAVDRPAKNGGRIYLDLTSDLTPYRDLPAKPQVTLTVHDAPVLSSTGGTRVFTLPAALPNYASLGLASQLERRKPRRFPIDISEVVGPIESVAELRMTIPPGWKADL